jgi:hypothetical protein
VGLASKVTWGQRLALAEADLSLALYWDVDVKPRGSSRPRGFSVNGWLGKADLGLAHATLACSSYNPETLLSLDIGR